MIECQMCGETNYSPSYGGPGICPSCDSGIDPQLTRARARIAALESEVAALRTVLSAPAGQADALDARRAFQIADAQMFVVMRSYGHKLADETGEPERYGVPTGYGRKFFADAVEWLERRGYVVRFTNHEGHRVRVLKEPSSG
jgi:hypothetical protein